MTKYTINRTEKPLTLRKDIRKWEKDVTKQFTEGETGVFHTYVSIYPISRLYR